MKKIAVVTGTRAEYGLLRPLLLVLDAHPDVDLRIYATGAHLSQHYGRTIEVVRKDFLQVCEVPILADSDTPADIAKAMGRAQFAFCEIFEADRPDCVVLLGDRYEAFAVASVCLVMAIAIAHIHGGETTLGAMDDALRHSISHMARWHFPVAQSYVEKLCALGVAPEHIFQVGALGLENIHSLLLQTPEAVYERLRLPIGVDYVVLTFHPETASNISLDTQIARLVAFLEAEVNQCYWVMTLANADQGGLAINQALQDFATRHPAQVRLFDSLGMVGYLSAVSYSKMVVGNSSSGIIEAPALGVPTLNLGSRQSGRARAKSIVDAALDLPEMIQAFERIRKTNEWVFDSPYDDKGGLPSEKITQILVEQLHG
jgi:UDP-hydrolysing UDP-N-acetyl-D-glucosamine 2-epimerase